MSRHPFSRRVRRRKRTGGRLVRLQEEAEIRSNKPVSEAELLRRLGRIRQLMTGAKRLAADRRQIWQSSGAASPKSRRSRVNREFARRVRSNRRRKLRPLGRGRRPR